MRAAFRERFALWFLGLALPKAEDLKPHLHSAMFSIGAAAMGGVMIALAAAAGLVACYSYLIARGTEELMALSLTSGIALAVAIIAFLASKKAMERTIEAPHSLELFTGTSGNVIEDAISLVFSGFLDGVLEEKDEAPRMLTHKPGTVDADVVEIAYGKANGHMRSHTRH